MQRNFRARGAKFGCRLPASKLWLACGGWCPNGCRAQDAEFGKNLLAVEAARAIVDFRRLDIHFNLAPKHAYIALLARCYVLIPV